MHVNEPAKNLKRFLPLWTKKKLCAVRMVLKREKGCFFEPIRKYKSNFVGLQAAPAPPPPQPKWYR